MLSRPNDLSRPKMEPNPDGNLHANPLVSPRGVAAAAHRGRISEDTPWEPPFEEVAKAFEDSLHPRRRGGGKFSVIEATTGRYCFLGGCGEQLDLWDEVRMGDGQGVDTGFLK